MIGLRQHASFVRAIAFSLLLLAASPFTAPFATLDLVPVPAAASVDAGKTKTGDDDLTAAIVITSSDRVVAAGRAAARASVPPRGRRHPHAILRL